MKILKYQQEYFDLTSEEADEISNMLLQKNKATHFSFRGQTLKTSFVEVREKKEEIVGERRVSEMTIGELKEIIGDFEKEYTEHQTGEKIHNQILGYEFEGIIDWCLKIGVITKKEKWQRVYYFITYGGIKWEKKLDAYRELLARRGFAKEREKEEINK